MKNLAIINIAGLSPLSYQKVLQGESAIRRVLDWGASIPGASGILLLADEDSILPEGAVVVGTSTSVDSPAGREPTAGAGSDAAGSGSSGPPSPPLRAIRKKSWNEQILMEALFEASRLPAGAAATDSPERYEALFYVWGDSPLIDRDLTETLWNLHYKYDAEYTFADGYPYGLSPEILSAALPEKLLPLASGRTGPVARDSLFEILRRDINAFDVETHLSPADMTNGSGIDNL